MNMIQADHITMVYPSGKGIFGVDFVVKENEVFGYLGPNGAGKTTTIRILMGFMKAQQGAASIVGLDSWKQHNRALVDVGYLPGEIAFFDAMSAMEFLNYMLALRHIKDKSRMKAMIDWFDFDSNMIIRKLSKGNKQKLGLISAFMHDPAIYILDEPTSGLDPLMQQQFVELVKQEKKRGKTFLMSSHSFDEVERTCDRVAMIKQGKIATIETIEILQAKRTKIFTLMLEDQADIKRLELAGYQILSVDGSRIDVQVEGDFKAFFNVLRKIELLDLSVQHQRLEQVFMQYYDKENHHD
jgi:ABC-2 type transport system ATP-binding protein